MFVRYCQVVDQLKRYLFHWYKVHKRGTAVTYSIKIQACQYLLRHKLVYNSGFQTLNCRYSLGIQPMYPNFCLALVTWYNLLP